MIREVRINSVTISPKSHKHANQKIISFLLPERRHFILPTVVKEIKPHLAYCRILDGLSFWGTDDLLRKLFAAASAKRAPLLRV